MKELIEVYEQNQLTSAEELNMNDHQNNTNSMQKDPKISSLSKLMSRIESKLSKPPITCGNWVLAIIIEAKFGLTADALRDYRRTIWAEGVHWQKNPKGRVVYNVSEVNKWMSTAS